MHKFIEVLKKHWVPIVAIGGGIIAWIYLSRKNAAPAATNPVGDVGSPQVVYATPGGGGGSSFINPGGTGAGIVDTSGGSSTTQPGTSSSGLPSATPAVIPYISPSQSVTDPSPQAHIDALTNPFATNLNPTSDPFGIAPTIPVNQIAQYSIPKPGGNIISAITAALTGRTSPTPAGGATTVDPALQNTLAVAAQPGGLARLPSNDPYLTSSAYTSLQASQLQGLCAADPNSPGCQVSIATGEISTGAPTAASETYRASTYCEGNHFNAGFFGSAPDTANCDGAQPKASLIQSLINQYIPQAKPAPSATPGGAIGNLPSNWNSLTYEQQQGYLATGVVPTVVSNANKIVASNTTQLTGITSGPNLNTRPPNTAIVPSHPNSGFGLPLLQEIM